MKNNLNKSENNILKNNLPGEDDMKYNWENYNNLKQEFPKPDMNSVWIKVSDSIDSGENKKKVFIKKSFYRYAAIIIFGIFISTIVYYTTIKDTGNISYIEYQASNTERLEVKLPDGSIIWLQPKSQLKYQNDFSSSNRSVYFTGKGYFDIVKNPQSSFVVHTENADIRVYGTKFYIKESANKELIETGLISGKIELFAKNTKKILTPNEIVVFSNLKNEIIETRDLNSNNYMWKNGNIVFKNKTIKIVLNELSDLYNIRIEADPKLDLSKKITLTLRNESVNEIMDIFEFLFSYDYKVDGDKVKITSHD